MDLPVVSCNTRTLARHLSGSYARKTRPRGKSNIQVRLGSALPDKCLICQGSILSGGKTIVCPYCGSVYHLECLNMAAESQGVPLEEVACFYCGRKMPVKEVLSLAG